MRDTSSLNLKAINLKAYQITLLHSIRGVLRTQSSFYDEFISQKSFILLFCFANFVNWRASSDWMTFEVVDKQVSRRSSFFSEILSNLGLSHRLLLLHSQELGLRGFLMILCFFFYLLC